MQAYPARVGQTVQTPLCRERGIDYPIFNAGIGSAAGPGLAAAVSNAGGLGVLGGSSFLQDGITRLVARTRELTGKPFGLNFIIDERGMSETTRPACATLRTARSLSPAMAQPVGSLVDMAPGQPPAPG